MIFWVLSKDEPPSCLCMHMLFHAAFRVVLLLPWRQSCRPSLGPLVLATCPRAPPSQSTPLAPRLPSLLPSLLYTCVFGLWRFGCSSVGPRTGFVAMVAETTAFSAVFAVQREKVTMLSKSGFQAGFLEKTMQERWSKQVVVIK